MKNNGVENMVKNEDLLDVDIKKLMPLLKKFGNSKTEYLYVVNTDGKIIKSAKGNVDSVKSIHMPKNKAKNLIMMHNHPRLWTGNLSVASPFSLEDLYGISTDGFGAEIVIDNNFIYLIQIPSTGKRYAWSTFKRVIEPIEFAEIDRYRNMVLKGKIDLKEYAKNAYHSAMLKMIKRLGWKYQRIPHKLFPVVKKIMFSEEVIPPSELPLWLFEDERGYKIIDKYMKKWESFIKKHPEYKKYDVSMHKRDVEPMFGGGRHWL